MTSEHQFKSRPGFWKEAAPCLDLLYNFAIRITGSEKIAYKLLKETYEKAYRFYSHLDESIIFDKWMLRIMKNTYLETFSQKLYLRKIDYEKIQTQFSQLESVDYERLKKDIIEKLTEKEIAVLLASMPDEYKMVIVCNSTLRFPYDEIVDFIDLLPGIVRLRIHRGRKILFILLYNYALEKRYIRKISESINSVEIKENRDYYYIAALADDELKNTPEETKTKELINKENELLFEYNVQVMIKKLLTEKLINATTPPGIKKKIERKFSLRA
jgi:RNA polymerase sigma-70 factor (ECF subfamily)